MATASKNGSRILGVKPAVVEQAKTFLQELPEKPKEDLSLKEAVERMKEPLQLALGKGYSYDSLAKMLSEQGIKISALTLKNYLPSGRRAAAKAKAAKAKKSTTEAAVETNAKPPEPIVEVAVSVPESEPTPKKSAGGRPKASAKAKAEPKTQATPAQPASATKSPPSRRRRLTKP